MQRHFPTLLAVADVFADSRRVRWPIVGPLVALAAFTFLFRWTTLDVAIARCFFDFDHRLWPGLTSEACLLIYRCGTVPPFALAVFAAVSVVWALFHARSWRALQPGVFLVVLFLLAPGLIVNQGLKNSWGRPRPHQLHEFGGAHAFVPVGEPGSWPRHNSSFPSGHAAVAFYLIAPAFLVGARRRRTALALMFGGLAFGSGMGAVRVIQGGHFVSDVVWAGAIVYFTGVILSRALLRPTNSSLVHDDWDAKPAVHRAA